MTISLRVSLLRHGHTTSGPVYRGRVDVPLSDKGWQQMQDAMQGMQPDMLVTSPLQRCADFAHSLDMPVITDERFLEMDFGAWDGVDRDQVWQQDQAAVEAFWANPMEVSPPGGENLAQVQARAMAALHEHIETAIDQAKTHLLIVSHGGVIRCLLGKLLHMSSQGLFHLYLPYAGLAHLKVDTFQPHEMDQQGYHISLDLGKQS
jgi:alpha-ribazole phosphatase